MATYEEVKDIQNFPDKFLIDVRNPDEIEETGALPASINIPLSELDEALDSSQIEFRKIHGRNKPTFESEIIFSCKAGGRAQRAAKAAKTKGYTKSRAYLGSWNEWAEKENL